MIAWVRGELMGPCATVSEPAVIEFAARDFLDPDPSRRGPLAWRPTPQEQPQEVLYYDRESPHRKYGVGLLHPAIAGAAAAPPDEVAVQATDTIGVDVEPDDTQTTDEAADEADSAAGGPDSSDDFEVTSPDVRHPSTIGISFCVSLNADGCIVIRLPQSRRFAWQSDDEPALQLNGRYESCRRRWTDDHGDREATIWRRYPAVLPDAAVIANRDELVSGRKIVKPVTKPDGSPIALSIEIFPRRARELGGIWLVTVVLRNITSPGNSHESILYQAYFEVSAERGALEKYPESQRPFDELDPEEKSLALLYRESATGGLATAVLPAGIRSPESHPRCYTLTLCPQRSFRV